jgi:hypothetical protein
MITPLVSSNSSYKKKFKQRWSTIPNKTLHKKQKIEQHEPQ